jgi:hypothetical protein
MMPTFVGLMFKTSLEDKKTVMMCNCCFIKHHIRKKPKYPSLKSPCWYSFNKCNMYILILNPTTLVILLISYFQQFPRSSSFQFQATDTLSFFFMSCPLVASTIVNLGKKIGTQRRYLSLQLCCTLNRN